MSGSCSNLSFTADSSGFQNPKFQKKKSLNGICNGYPYHCQIVWWKKTWYIMIFNLCLSSSSCFSPASWGTSSDKHGLMIVLMFCVPRLWCSILRSGSKRDLFGVPTGPNSSALEVPVVPRDIHIIVRQAQKRTLGTLSCWSARVGDAGIPNFSWNLDKSHRR